MTATKRQLDAYRNRLSKIEHASQLTAECVGAVVEVWDLSDGETPIVGTLTSYTHRISMGLLGDSLLTDITVCTACAHRPGDCSDATVREVAGAILREIVRNGDRKGVTP